MRPFAVPPARFAAPVLDGDDPTPVLPLVEPPAVEPEFVPPPEVFAVPRALVPGAFGVLDALPAPLGSFPELLSPPTLAAPLGTPLTPAVPAPAEPAFGEPTALPEPVEGPLAAPPAADPPADAPPPEAPPPADPPPPPPPPPP